MSDEWIKTLTDRRKVKFTNQELDEKAFLTAQIEGNKGLRTAGRIAGMRLD